MTDPRGVTAHFGPTMLAGHILALEGGGGYLRVLLKRAEPHPWPEAGHQGELEMHDGARFGMVVTECHDTAQEANAEFRMKLVDRGG